LTTTITRYDRLAQNFLAAVHIAAAVSYWLAVCSLVGPFGERQQNQPGSLSERASPSGA
jgi:hypothetical protein